MRAYRTFLIGLIFALLPVHLCAQQAAPHRVGILAQDLQPGLLETLRDEFRRLGYVEGKTLFINLRNAEGHNDRLPGMARELLDAKADVIIAVNTPAALASKKATATVPIVILRVADPVKSGLVTSLARPGANVTGISFMPDALGPKGVELLREIIPGVSRMTALYQGDNAGAVLIVDEVVRTGERLGVTFIRTPVIGPEDYANALESAAKAGAQAVFVMDDGAITAHRARILELAARHSLPVVSIYTDFANSGALLSYGPDLVAVYRRGADYVDKLLKGASPGNLPVEQPNIFKLVINLKTARDLKISIPRSVLARADDVIQ
jgi:putative tryptophan/tyrosine transport system substrate-binding protein